MSVSSELAVISLVVLIPLTNPDRLPHFHFRGISVGAPIRAMEPKPMMKQPAGARTVAASSHRIYSPIRLSAGNRVYVSELAQIDLPGPIAEFEPSTDVGVSIDKLLPPALALRPPESIKPAAKAPSQPIRVSTGAQMAKLVRKVIPEYPVLAKAARISGVVHLIGTIAKDGTIQNLQLVSGHPLLARAAIEAVKQWVYQPTLLNGEPVEVIAPIDVNFTLGQ